MAKQKKAEQQGNSDQATDNPLSGLAKKIASADVTAYEIVSALAGQRAIADVTETIDAARAAMGGRPMAGVAGGVKLVIDTDAQATQRRRLWTKATVLDIRIIRKDMMRALDRLEAELRQQQKACIQRLVDLGALNENAEYTGPAV